MYYSYVIAMDKEIRALLKLLKMSKGAVGGSVELKVDANHRDTIEVTFSPLTVMISNDIKTFNEAKELLQKMWWNSLHTAPKGVKGSQHE